MFVRTKELAENPIKSRPFFINYFTMAQKKKTGKKKLSDKEMRTVKAGATKKAAKK